MTVSISLNLYCLDLWIVLRSKYRKLNYWIYYLISVLVCSALFSSDFNLVYLRTCIIMSFWKMAWWVLKVNPLRLSWHKMPVKHFYFAARPVLALLKIYFWKPWDILEQYGWKNFWLDPAGNRMFWNYSEQFVPGLMNFAYP